MARTPEQEAASRKELARWRASREDAKRRVKAKHDKAAKKHVKTAREVIPWRDKYGDGALERAAAEAKLQSKAQPKAGARSAPRPRGPSGREVAGADPSIFEFHDHGNVVEHAQFQAWREAHPLGFFLTFKSTTTAMLHGATGCWHPGNVYWMPEDSRRRSSLAKKRKVCSAVKASLLSFGNRHGVEIERCTHCFG